MGTLKDHKEYMERVYTVEKRAHLLASALISGEFEQGRRKLYDGACYCVMGVACEIFRRETGKGEWKEPEEYGELAYSFVVEGEDDSEGTPSIVDDWYNGSDMDKTGDNDLLTELNDRFTDGGYIRMNDDHKDFAYLASRIKDDVTHRNRGK